MIDVTLLNPLNEMIVKYAYVKNVLSNFTANVSYQSESHVTAH
jgi:hypothetical protein